MRPLYLLSCTLLAAACNSPRSPTHQLVTESMPSGLEAPPPAAASVATKLPQPPRESLPAKYRFVRERPLTIGGEIGKVADGRYQMPNGLYAVPLCPFESGQVEVRASVDTTSVLRMVGEHDWAAVVIATRIRDEYPKDDSLLVDKVLPDAELHARSNAVSHSWRNLGGTLVLQELNKQPSYSGRDDLDFVVDGYGTSNRASGACRVDRHFVKYGYYMQIVAMTRQTQPPEESCPAALELADWTLAHMQFAPPSDGHGVPGDPKNLLGKQQVEDPAAASGALDPRVVGAWELERYDNVQRDNVPPSGPFNILYLFHPDGRAEDALPGPPSGAPVPQRMSNVSLRNNILYGYIGLTTDERSPQTVELLTSDRLRLALADGSIASLRRVSQRPEPPSSYRPRCIPLTVRGHYDRSFVEGIERTLSTAADPAWQKKLLGTWQLEGEQKEDRVTMQFLPDGRYRKTLSIPHWTSDQGEPMHKVYGEPMTSEGRYQLHSDILTILGEDSCNPSRVRFSSKKLELSSDGKQWLTLSAAAR